MAKKPKKNPGIIDEEVNEWTTRQVRLKADLADMLGWISRLIEKDTGHKFSSARWLDPLVRGPIEAEYAQYAARVEKIKRALGEEG